MYYQVRDVFHIWTQQIYKQTAGYEALPIPAETSILNRIVNITKPRSYTSANHEELWTDLKTQIDNIKTQSSTTLSVHDIHQYSILYSTISILILGLFIFFTVRWCKMRQRWCVDIAESSVVVRMDALPKHQPSSAVKSELRSSILSVNEATLTTPLKMPRSVKFNIPAVLDLRNNSVISADAAAATMLFSNKRSKIWLSGSTVDCGCDEENLPWLTAFLENIKQIEDYQTVSCSEYTKGLLKNLNINELCAEPWTVWPLISLSALICICAIVAGLIVKRYQKQIRVFLFIHGLCLSCVQEEDLDADKQYDIFISFCHEDDDFVMDEILPKLSMYNLCIHYRDWMAGEWIPAQIARSVHDSKRTIIVISKSFLRSSWGLMEFRMAHAATAEAGRARVIVVLREEVFNLPELDTELKSYLSTNTYVKWGDPWFFDKLRYALPREPIGQREELARDGDDFRMAVKVYRRDDGETTLNGVE